MIFWIQITLLDKILLPTKRVCVPCMHYLEGVQWGNSEWLFLAKQILFPTKRVWCFLHALFLWRVLHGEIQNDYFGQNSVPNQKNLVFHACRGPCLKAHLVHAAGRVSQELEQTEQKYPFLFLSNITWKLPNRILLRSRPVGRQFNILWSSKQFWARMCPKFPHRKAPLPCSLENCISLEWVDCDLPSDSSFTFFILETPPPP